MQQSFPSGRGFPRESTPPVIRVDHAEEEDGSPMGQESSPERRIHPTMGIAGGSLLGPMYNTNVSTTNCEKNLTTQNLPGYYGVQTSTGVWCQCRNRPRARSGSGMEAYSPNQIQGNPVHLPKQQLLFFFSGVSSIKSLTRGAPLLPIYLPYRLSSS